MSKKETKALKAFRSGYNCSQSVLSAFSEELGFDNNLALSVSCGFGGGMGKLQLTCGAVTGSFMVLGIYNSSLYTENSIRKEKTYAMIQKFNEKFEAIHGTTNCKSLINCDLNTDDGQKYAKEHRIFETLCEKCISDSIGILEELTEV